MESHSDSEEVYKIPGIPERLLHGADELNFAEFPICSFASNWLHKGYHVVEDQVPDPTRPGKMVTRRFEVLASSESDPLGPLTPDDDWVLFGIFQLSKLQGFPKTVHFTRYQLLNLLGWQTNARDYAKLKDSLFRLKTYNFRFYNGFFDAQAKSFVDAAFGLFSDVNVYALENSLTRPKPDPHQETFHFACSSVTWSNTLQQQFHNRGVKGINFDFAKSLKRPLSRRLFRFLDKNFYFKPELSYDLESFVTAHLGLKAGQHVAAIKRTLSASLKELEDLGFLLPLPEDERFVKLRCLEKPIKDDTTATGKTKGRFKYQIVFQKGQLDAAAKEQQGIETPSDEDSRRAAPLVNRGVSQDQALKLARSYPDTIITHAVDVADWHKTKNIPFKNSMGAFLYDRIVNHKDRQDPAGFISRAKRAQMLEEKKAKELKERQQKASAEEIRAKALADFEVRFSAWWETLGEDGRKSVDDAILAHPHDPITLGYLESKKDSTAVRAMWKAQRIKAFSEQTGVKAWGE